MKITSESTGAVYTMVLSVDEANAIHKLTSLIKLSEYPKIGMSVEECDAVWVIFDLLDNELKDNGDRT